MTLRRRRFCLVGLVAAASLMLPRQSHAAAPSTPQQLAGLFMQACLPFAGDATALRSWARQTGLAALPDPARAAFLHGAPGVAFDASTPASKLVIASSDDGICSVFTNLALGPTVVSALESDLASASIAFRMVIERNDKQIPTVHDREYLATKSGRSWRILATTVTDLQPGQAMLTAAPE